MLVLFLAPFAYLLDFSNNFMDLVIVSQQKHGCIFAKIIIFLYLLLGLLAKSIGKRFNFNDCNNLIAVNNHTIKPTTLIAILKVRMEANRMALMIKFCLQVCLASMLGFYKFHTSKYNRCFRKVKGNFILSLTFAGDMILWRLWRLL